MYMEYENYSKWNRILPLSFPDGTEQGKRKSSRKEKNSGLSVYGYVYVYQLIETERWSEEMFGVEVLL
jgi:hypothetical protein